MKDLDLDLEIRNSKGLFDWWNGNKIVMFIIIISISYELFIIFISVYHNMFLFMIKLLYFKVCL